MATNTKKDKFYSVLKNIFIGAKIEGNSGYVNLMRIKNKYYNEFKQQLQKDINKKLAEVGWQFEEELYNKLYTFFKKYFSESGSIYFSYTPLHEKVYEKIYRDDKDVILFWKTHMLYYVKTERLYQNMDFQDEDNLIWYHFDVSELEHKQNNEKKELIFEYANSHFKDGKREIFFKVEYSKNGSKTKINDILKKIKKSTGAFGSYKEQDLKRALGIFRKQSEVDYFINKNAKAFLREQFSLWIKTYVFDDDTVFEEARLKQLKALRDIAYNIIDLVSQFEDELVKIWNKPKFAHTSNYVITLDKIADKNLELLKKILKSKGTEKQIKEWQELGMIDKKFKIEDIFETGKEGKIEFEEDKKPLNEKWQYLPLDTKYFKEFEYDILALFDDLDNQLNGWLIHSENYQALNTLKHKFREKVQTIYIDPPFNTNSTPIIYINNYKHSSWLSLMSNRLEVSKSFLTQNGINITAIDDVELRYLITTQDQVFGSDNYISVITTQANPQGRVSDKVSKTTEFHIIHCKDISYIDKLSVIKHGEKKTTSLKRTGTNSRREERPYRYYPILIKNNRVSLITDEEYSKIYNPKTKKFNDLYVDELKRKYENLGYYFLLPEKNDKTKLVWQRTFQRVKQEKDSYIVKNNMVYSPAYDYEIPKTLWKLPIYSNPEYGSEYLKHVLGHNEFETPKSYFTIKQFLSMFDNIGIFLDYFAGSGTTIDAVIKMNQDDDGDRKFIAIELGDHFNTVIIPRIKKISFTDKWKNGKAQEGGQGYSNFFKYYKLEQYEETLRKAKYEDKGALPKDIYHQYLFFKDLKLADIVAKLDDKSRSIKVDLTKLHDKIDIPETLSFLTGKFIKQIFKDKVVFTDGSEIEYANIDYKIVKPLIWW